MGDAADMMFDVAMTQEVEKPSPLMASGRYLNDKLYADYEWEDETSQFDPKGRWVGGSEYYSRTYRCRVPKGLLKLCEATGDHEILSDWIYRNQEKPIWLD